MDMQKAKDFIKEASFIHGKKHALEDIELPPERLAFEHWHGFMEGVYKSLGINSQSVDELGAVYVDSFIKGSNSVLDETIETILKGVGDTESTFDFIDILRLVKGVNTDDEPLNNFIVAWEKLSEGHKGVKVIHKGYGKWELIKDDRK